MLTSSVQKKKESAEKKKQSIGSFLKEEELNNTHTHTHTHTKRVSELSIYEFMRRKEVK